MIVASTADGVVGLATRVDEVDTDDVLERYTRYPARSPAETLPQLSELPTPPL
ncbi:hypothetical protein IFT45_11045 [Frigoribacterium sp. CFBP 13707]|nr:hypothetical protein [Frigoribacterium sp. CFBP 13707]